MAEHEDRIVTDPRVLARELGLEAERERVQAREAELVRLLRAFDNHASYLSAELRASVGRNVCVPRGYLERVVRNLRKLGRLTERYDEAAAAPVQSIGKPT